MGPHTADGAKALPGDSRRTIGRIATMLTHPLTMAQIIGGKHAPPTTRAVLIRLMRLRTAFEMILPPSSWCRPPYFHFLYEALPKLLCLISKYLSLPTDELALKLSQFLRFPHMNQLLSKLESI